MRRALICVAVLLVFIVGQARGAILPHNSVVQMCATADLIVEGVADDEGNGFTLSAVLFGPGVELEPGDRITVTHLAEHNRLFGGFHQPREAITTRRAVLFLTADDFADSFTPIAFVRRGEAPVGGSRGLLWWDGERCMGYAQQMNPGPFMLGDAEHTHGTADLPALRTRIVEGLALAERWRLIREIADETQRAEAIASASQAADGLRPLFSLRREMAGIGGPAVDPLIAVLDTSGPNVNLSEVVLSLYSIGQRHPEAVARATGLLCERLADPGPTPRYYILSALTATRDPAAIPSVRPMLTEEGVHLQARVQAAEALAAMGDTASYDAVAALLDGVIDTPREDGDNTGFSETVDLLNALFQLDPERAESAIERVRQTPGICNAVSHVVGYVND